MHWLVVTLVMLAGGTVFFGWRGMIGTCITALATLVSYMVLSVLVRFLYPQHRMEPSLYALWMGLLAGLCLPVVEGWQFYLTIGIGVGAAAHVVGRVHRVRVHPVALGIVVLLLLPSVMFYTQPSRLGMPYGASDTEDSVLRPNHLVLGDVLYTTSHVSTQAWNESAGISDAVRRHNPGILLAQEQHRILRHPSLLTNLLSSGELVRLEELLAGAVPGPIGATSPVLLIAAGVYLAFVRLLSPRMVFAALITATLTYMLIPVRMGEHWVLTLNLLAKMSPAQAITLMAYVLLGSALPLVVLILAPAVAPMSRHGRAVYGGLLGVGVMLCYVTLMVPMAAFLPVLAVGLLSRPLDALQRSPFHS